MINNRSNKIKDMNVINNKLFNILRDLNITCAEFAQAVKDVLNGEHYVWLENKYDAYDKFLPIAKINVETADIYVGIPVNKVLNIYYINLSCGYCVFDETVKCDINDINKYRFVAYKPVSPAMIDSMTMLIRQLQEKEQQQQ